MLKSFSSSSYGMFRPVAMCRNAVVVNGSYAVLGLEGVKPCTLSPSGMGRIMPPWPKSIAERFRPERPSMYDFSASPLLLSSSTRLSWFIADSTTRPTIALTTEDFSSAVR